MVVWMGSFVAWTTSLGDTSATNVLSLKKETLFRKIRDRKPLMTLMTRQGFFGHFFCQINSTEVGGFWVFLKLWHEFFQDFAWVSMILFEYLFFQPLSHFYIIPENSEVLHFKREKRLSNIWFVKKSQPAVVATAVHFWIEKAIFVSSRSVGGSWVFLKFGLSFHEKFLEFWGFFWTKVFSKWPMKPCNMYYIGPDLVRPHNFPSLMSAISIFAFSKFWVLALPMGWSRRK